MMRSCGCGVQRVGVVCAGCRGCGRCVGLACRHVGVVCVGVGGGVRWSVGCVVVSVGWQSVHGSVGVCAVCRYGACSVCVMVWLWCDVIMWCGLLLMLRGSCAANWGWTHGWLCSVQPCPPLMAPLASECRARRSAHGVVFAGAITNGLRAWHPSCAPSHRHP